MKRKSLVLLLALVLVFSFISCTTLEVKDPIRTGLYAIKQEWVAMREYMIVGNLNDTISNEQLNEFKELDDQFSLLYEVTVNLYVSGTDDVAMETNIRTLRNLLLNARAKYYKGGN